MKNRCFPARNGNSLVRTLVTAMTGVVLFAVLTWSLPKLHTALANGQVSGYLAQAGKVSRQAISYFTRASRRKNREAKTFASPAAMAQANGPVCSNFSNRTKAAGRVQILSSRTGKVIVELQGEQRGEGFGTSLCALSNWTRKGTSSLAIAARRGGPIGAGYVRIFRIDNGAPQQTFTTGAGTAIIGHSLAAVGDTDGDGYPELLTPSIARNSRSYVWSVNFLQTIPR